MFFQELFDFNRGHATGACGCDGLTVAAVLHIPGSKDARNFREHVVVSLEVAVGVGVELIGEHPGIRLMADPEE